MTPRAWVTRDIEQGYGPGIRCNFHTRVYVPAERTPSGTAYTFEPEEIKEDVYQEDMDYLLSLVYNQQSACCGNEPGEPIHYFVLV